MRGYRFYLTLTLVAFCMLNAPSIMKAQSLSDARSSFSKGQYKTAVSYYNAIIEDYKDNGHSTFNLEQERSKAITCRDLLSEVERLKKKHRYSDAIAKLRQIVNLNPSDSTIKTRIQECESLKEQYLAQKAIEDDWNNCLNLSDYYTFRRLHPNSKYDSQANSKIKELEVQADEERWKLALSRNTVESYQSYINSKTGYSSHLAEANQKLFPLLISRAARFFDNHDFASAKSVYEKAKQLFSLPDISSKNYRKCCEEVDFEKLSKASYRFKTDLQGFISQYPYSEHVSLVRGWLVEKEMSSGNFDAARSIVENYTVSFSESFTPDVKWWRKNIKAREKQYKKNHRNTTASHPSSIKTMWGLGASYNLSGFNNDGYLGLNASFSIGTFDNRFNWDFSVSPLFLVKKDTYGAERINFLCPITTTGPRLNINKRDGGDFFMALEPEVGYCIGASGVYGGKLIMGYDFFGVGIEALGSMKTLSAETKWSSNFMYLGFSATFYF